MWVSVGVKVGVHVGERSGVWKWLGARLASGSPGFGVWDSPIHRGPLRLRGRSTMVRPLREILGPVGPWEAVGKVVPGCAVPGLIGDPHHREMVSVGVGVMGRCFLRSPLTSGVR